MGLGVLGADRADGEMDPVDGMGEPAPAALFGVAAHGARWRVRSRSIPYGRATDIIRSRGFPTLNSSILAGADIPEHGCERSLLAPASGLLARIEIRRLREIKHGPVAVSRHVCLRSGGPLELRRPPPHAEAPDPAAASARPDASTPPGGVWFLHHPPRRYHSHPTHAELDPPHPKSGQVPPPAPLVPGITASSQT